MGNFGSKFSAWLDEPFSEGMDAVGWFLLVGLILASIFVWSLIINQIAE